MSYTFSFQQIAAAPKCVAREVRVVPFFKTMSLQFYVRDQQQDTQVEGITALYERPFARRTN